MPTVVSVAGVARTLPPNAFSDIVSAPWTATWGSATSVTVAFDGDLTVDQRAAVVAYLKSSPERDRRTVLRERTDALCADLDNPDIDTSVRVRELGALVCDLARHILEEN